MKGIEQERTRVLSERLRMLAGMVTPGNRVVDVGCDHGFLDIYLVRQGICPGALAMDVREGPLRSAGEHVRRAGLGGYIEIRMSDGLAECGLDEADTLVCAGMGGRLMERILTEGQEKARRMRELILQPQSELPEFRRFLRNAGFGVICEDAVFEDGKYYFAMKAAWEGRRETCPQEIKAQETRMYRSSERQELYDFFGGLLLETRHPVLYAYLRQRETYLRELKASMMEAGTRKAQGRFGEFEGELAKIGQALSFFEGKG